VIKQTVREIDLSEFITILIEAVLDHG